VIFPYCRIGIGSLYRRDSVFRDASSRRADGQDRLWLRVATSHSAAVTLSAQKMAVIYGLVRPRNQPFITKQLAPFLVTDKRVFDEDDHPLYFAHGGNTGR
jgi:hypothetical protein